MDLIFFGMILPWLLLAVSWWLVFQLLQQGGRILLRLEAVEQKLGSLTPAKNPQVPPPSQLAIGEPAPEFDLPDLLGSRHRLKDFLGRNVLLVFFSPQCGFCMQMLPELTELAAGTATEGRPELLIISNGEAAQNRELFAEAGIRGPILLQNGMEVASRYHVQGTPMGYLIDEKGAIASGRAVGSPSLLAVVAKLSPPPASLAELNGDTRNGTAAHRKASEHGATSARGKENKGLANSRIKRDGLDAGTLAPNFKLPSLSGEEIELEKLRGKPVLLVFSDPECGPCEQTSAHLERLHRQRQDFQVLMVSRRDAELNRRKVEALGLTFPVVLQKAWEISKLYAMFTTPVGYWIDEQGVVSKKVAVGLEAIQALAATPAMVNGRL